LVKRVCVGSASSAAIVKDHDRQRKNAEIINKWILFTVLLRNEFLD